MFALLCFIAGLFIGAGFAVLILMAMMVGKQADEDDDLAYEEEMHRLRQG